MDFSAPCMSGSWRWLGTTCLFSVEARCRYKSSTSEAEKTHSSLTLPYSLSYSLSPFLSFHAMLFLTAAFIASLAGYAVACDAYNKVNNHD